MNQCNQQSEGYYEQFWLLKHGFFQSLVFATSFILFPSLTSLLHTYTSIFAVSNMILSHILSKYLQCRLKKKPRSFLLHPCKPHRSCENVGLSGETFLLCCSFPQSTMRKDVGSPEWRCFWWYVFILLCAVPISAYIC
jgi:hypothetical protein